MFEEIKIVSAHDMSYREPEINNYLREGFIILEARKYLVSNRTDKCYMVLGKPKQESPL